MYDSDLIASLQSALDDKNAQIAAQSSQIEDLTNQINTANASISSLNDQITALTPKAQNADALQATVDSLNAAAATFATQLAAKDDQISILESNGGMNPELQNQLNTANSRVDYLQAIVDKLKADIATMQIDANGQ